MSGAILLDDLDRVIIDRLATDARVSNRELARQLRVTESTIRVRLKRLFDANAIRVSLIRNSDQLSNPLLAYLFIEAESSHHVERVARCLAELPEITFVATLLGRGDVLAMTLVEDGDKLTELLHKTIDKIPGVHAVQYSLGQHFVKHDYRWCVIRE